jgi:GH24 family phage-related lysozyme (muramidase)
MDQMTQEQWLAEVQRRIGISEGDRAVMYHDSEGIPTIGIGFNLQRADASSALQQAGVPASEAPAVMSGAQPLTTAQISALFAISFAPIVAEARDSLAAGVFDAMTDARRFVICDLVYNMGDGGWVAFTNTRAAIATAEEAKEANATDAHPLFVEAAQDLSESAWFSQVGDRAGRDVAMLREGVWCDPTGNGSDI